MSRKKQQSRRALRPRLLTHAIILSIAGSAPSLAFAQAAYTEQGKVGNAESWRSDEFKKDWGLGAVGADHAYARGLSGAGINVGVLDDGTAAWHSELSGKTHNLLAHDQGCSSPTTFGGPDACFYSDGGVGYTYTRPMNPEQRAFFEGLVKEGKMPQKDLDFLRAMEGYVQRIHGTHVGGIVGANRNGSGMHGVAFGSELYSAVTDSNRVQNFEALWGRPGGEMVGTAANSETRAAIQSDFAKSNVRVVNNSWGMPAVARNANELDAAAATIKQMVDDYAGWTRTNRIIQVWSAGNNAGAVAHVLAAVPRYHKDAEPYWIATTNLTAEKTISPGSNICGPSKDWCISAPGTGIISAVPEGKVEGEILRDAKGNVTGMKINSAEHVSGYASHDGTSMAAPHVSGGLALLMERYPYLDNAQVRDVLLTTAEDLGEAGVDEIYGWGLMDLKKAIDGPSQMRVDSEVKMDRRAGGAKVWSGEAWDDWRNDIGGTGKLTKSGEGWLRLSGNNSFGGVLLKEGVLELDGRNALASAVRVDGGHLLLDGQLVKSNLELHGGQATVQGQVEQGRTLVGKEARLQGTGTLADTQVAGIIAPGVDGIGTLTVNGTYTQQAGSVYEVDAQSGGTSDLVDVRGKAALEGGQVRVSGATLGERYRIVSAQEVSGSFAGASTLSSQPFLSLSLNHTPRQVSIDVARGQSLASAAYTSNQLGVAMAADAASDQDVVLQRLTRLDVPQALSAFERLSAETHASQRAVWLEQGHDLNQAAAQRLRSVQDAFVQQAEGHNGVWVDAHGRGGHLDGDGNAARVDYQGSGLTVGYDRRVGADWTLGVLGATGKGEIKVRERGSRSEDRSRHLGVYAGKQWGALALRGGWLMSDHRTDANRQVAYGTFNERQQASYTSHGQQGFVEAGYAWQVGGQVMLEPYAQWSHVRVSTPRFQERGGLTALQVDAGHSQVDFATAGLRMAADLATGGGQDWLQLGGGVAYRHAQGDLRSIATASWQGGADFSSWSAPLAEKATLLNLTLGARLSPHTLLQLGYDGQFAADAHDHAVNARFSLQF
ncbi:autotransporter domain-containing protein [Pseudoxanthomonas indica]|uniref:Subtilase-type serine protease n=1 Tax=Pseudoxanthomonas indica TaxID=428993 RepID=A0A1T5JFB2_9GAMM|nr:autotransporter domain-containing protein [Pseudoxanthomonas indica]GGD58378.1 outer membrane autotransporter barrel domain-containing protein [Pseudoxanthomonas indica]SKC50161.1 subtilase-type serine protease [Pseudoxanthomonas indica]